MLTRMKPGSQYQRRRGQGCATDDVGPAHTGLQIVDRLDVEISAGEAESYSLRTMRISAPHAHRGDRTRGGIGVDDMRCQCACSDHEQPARLRVRQVARCQRRGGCGAAPGQFRAVERRDRRAVGGIEQRIRCMHCGTPLAGVAWKHGNELDADASPRLPRRHRQQQLIAVG